MQHFVDSGRGPNRSAIITWPDSNIYEIEDVLLLRIILITQGALQRKMHENNNILISDIENVRIKRSNVKAVNDLAEGVIEYP